MRKLLYTFAALASMLAVAASCQRETPEGSTPDGDLIDVSMNFTVDDGRPATKAIGDGLTANKLTFLAYDEKGNYLSAQLPTNSGYENLSSKAGTVKASPLAIMASSRVAWIRLSVPSGKFR